MFRFGNGFDGVRSLVQFAVAYQSMALAAGEIVFRRSMMMASGSFGVTDAVDLVVEKATTFAEAAGEATTALVRGEDAGGVATAALEPYAERTTENLRELRG
jgi:hypothetical protein